MTDIFKIATSILIGNLVTIVGVLISATFLNQAKRAWEKHHDTIYSLRMLSGTLLNICRHYVATAKKISAQADSIDGRSIEKAIINNEFISETIKSNVSTIGSERITFELHRFVLTMRNTNIEYAKLIKGLGEKDSLTMDAKGLEIRDDIIDRTNYTAQAAYDFHEELSRLSRARNTKKNFLWALLYGETEFVSNLNDKFSYERQPLNEGRIKLLYTLFS